MRLADGVVLGALLGTGFGVWNLIGTWIDPLEDDTIAALLTFYGPMFAAWGIAGFVAARRSGRIVDGIRFAAAVAFGTFAVFVAVNLVRINLFFDAVLERADWQNMVARFRASGAGSLRAAINYNYVADAPFKILVASLIGAATGLVGALTATAVRHDPRQLPR
jgi:hypothetical protein